MSAGGKDALLHHLSTRHGTTFSRVPGRDRLVRVHAVLHSEGENDHRHPHEGSLAFRMANLIEDGDAA